MFQANRFGGHSVTFMYCRLNQTMHLKKCMKEELKEFNCEECAYVESSVGFGIFDKPVKEKRLPLYQCDQCGYSTKKAKVEA